MRALSGGRILGVMAALSLLLAPAIAESAPSDTPMQLVGTLPVGGQATGQPSHVFVADGLAYVAAGRSIWIVDVSDPARPHLVTTIAPRDSAQDIYVASGFAFVADSDGGLTVIDVSNPASPMDVGFLDTPGAASRIAVDSGRAYISESPGRIRIIDVSDPHLPVEISSMAFGSSERVCVSGNLAFMLDNNRTWGADLWVVDVSDPQSPVPLGDYTITSYNHYCFWAKGLDVRGSCAFVTVLDYYHSVMQDYWYYDNRLEVVDVSNPLVITRVGGLFTGEPVPGPVCADSSYALMCLDDGRVQMVDARTPTHPVVIGEIHLLGSLSDVIVSGGYGYVAAGASGLQILRLRFPPPGSTILGRVRGNCGVAGSGVGEVTVLLTGAVTKSVVTTGAGAYRFDSLKPGDYTVTPSKPGLVVTPPSRSYDSLTTDQLDQDFIWAQPAHTIAGRASESSGSPLADVIVTVWGCGYTTDTTGTDGVYRFEQLPFNTDWYDITLEKPGWVFTPPNRRYSGLTSDSLDQDFTAQWIGFSLSGRVRGDSSLWYRGIPDVTVGLSGDADSVVVTDASGDYQFKGLDVGAYCVTPSKPGWTFTPISRQYPQFHGDLAWQCFVGVAGRYSVSGVVRDGSGGGVGGVVVRTAGQRVVVDTTGTDGAYVLAGLEAGDYAVSPSKLGWIFSPASREYEPLASDELDQDFAAELVAVGISGCVRGPDGDGVHGVVVELAGDASDVDTTGAGGCYAFMGLDPGSYSVTPSKPGWTFEPRVRWCSEVATSQTDQDFAGTVIAHVRVFRTVDGAVRIEALPDRSGSMDAGVFTVTGQRLWRTEVEVTLGEPRMVEWNRENAAGRSVGSGVYILRISGAGLDETKKIAIVR